MSARTPEKAANSSPCVTLRRVHTGPDETGEGGRVRSVAQCCWPSRERAVAVLIGRPPSCAVTGRGGSRWLPVPATRR
jgi:hypothetical protein